MIFASSQQFLDVLNKALVKALGECRSWVVAQDAHQHDGIVLYVRLGRIIAGEEAFDLLRGSSGGDGRGLGRLDNDGEMEDFFVAIGVWSGLAEEADAASGVRSC
jgi:hypothetical protein